MGTEDFFVLNNLRERKEGGSSDEPVKTSRSLKIAHSHACEHTFSADSNFFKPSRGCSKYSGSSKEACEIDF